MARIPIDSELVVGALLLGVTDKIQRIRADIARVCDIMDYTRSGSDFAPLGLALGCSALEAETLYSRYRAIEETMDGQNFVNLSDIDQG